MVTLVMITFQNRGENVTITGGTGNDKIANETHNVIINSGADNDTISNRDANVIIYGGAGNDIISSRDNGDNWRYRRRCLLFLQLP